jgi:hypothetical protein
MPVRQFSLSFMLRNFALSLLLAAALLHGPARIQAEERVTPDPFLCPQIQEIQSLHTQAEAGDKATTKALVSRLEALCAEAPDNHLLLAYLGSAYTLASRDALPGPKKLEYLKTGLKTMDQAVEADPQAVAPRFIRAVNNFHLPAFINRRDNARADFEVLLGQMEQPGLTLDPATRQAIHYYAGLAFKQLRRKDEARSAWQKGWDLDHHSELATKIAAELKKLKT